MNKKINSEIAGLYHRRVFLKEDSENLKTSTNLDNIYFVGGTNDLEEFSRSLIEVLEKLGVYMVADPICEGSGDYGFLVSKEPFTVERLKAYVEESCAEEDEETKREIIDGYDFSQYV